MHTLETNLKKNILDFWPKMNTLTESHPFLGRPGLRG